MAGNILDYLEWRGDITFDQSGFNAVDALILSTVTYINYPNANEGTTTFKQGYIDWLELPDDEKFRGLGIVRKRTEELAAVIAAAKRFDDVKITRYVELTSQEIEKQFSAMTFLLPDGSAFIAFRGTDSSIVGWKEDFNMAVVDGTPSQLEAVRYVDMIADEFPHTELSIGGHSKGGNLAIWSATYMSEKNKARLKRVYIFDSPGLSRKVFESENYQSIEDKSISFVPESSIVGIIMYNPPQLVVKSNAEAFMQHDPFSWQIRRTGFEFLPERNTISRYIEKLLDKKVETMDSEEYIGIVNSIYEDILETSDFKKSIDNFIHSHRFGK